MRKAQVHRAPAIAFLVALILVVLVIASFGGLSIPQPLELVLWCFVAALAAAHRPFGGVTLGLGVLALPAVIMRLGVLSAALVAAGARLLASTWWHLATRRRRASRGLLGSEMFAALIVFCCTLAAALMHRAGDGSLDRLAGRVLAPMAAYSTVFLVIVVLASLVDTESWRRIWPGREAADLSPLALDAAGWALGIFLADTALVLGWERVAPLLLACALLAAEAARNAMARGTSDHRAENLERLQGAHERILGETSGMGAVAQQVWVECSNILPVQWFQFELADSSEPGQLSFENRSWWAGPERVLAEGVPQPAARPRMLPGVHRRAEWRVLEKALVVEGEALAVVRLWCDPRRIDPGAEELLSTLVPQMASSVHRARLDREARLDPLTGVPVRRILDSGIQQAYRDCCEDGQSMAVILCDIDHFKQVNDTHGHVAGDEALIQVARALDGERRENDLLSRYGGEEFTVLLNETGGAAALQLAERLRAAVAAIELEFEGRSIPLTLSAGVAAFPELHIKTASELLLLADEALYEAKERGRNRCLLNLGRGAYRTVSGAKLEPPTGTTDPLPRIFG
ncbi:MAG: GGDEF domain-containing protein [Acidobacteriota bacterium]